MTTSDRYSGPLNPGTITSDDVHQALAFLIALEPDEEDAIESDEVYKAALEAFPDEAERRDANLRQSKVPDQIQVEMRQVRQLV